MEGSYSFRDFLRDNPGERFLSDWALAIAGLAEMLVWLASLPFMPVVLAVRRRIVGKRLAAAWKRRNGYACPETYVWWMKYM